MPDIKALETAFLNPTLQDTFFFFDGGIEGLRLMLNQHKWAPCPAWKAIQGHAAMVPQPTTRPQHPPSLQALGAAVPVTSYSWPRPGHSLLKSKKGPSSGTWDERISYACISFESTPRWLCHAPEQLLQVGPTDNLMDLKCCISL